MVAARVPDMVSVLHEMNKKAIWSRIDTDEHG